MITAGPAADAAVEMPGSLFLGFVQARHPAELRSVAGVCTAAAFMGIREDQLQEEALLALDELERRFHSRPEVWGDLRLAMNSPRDPARDDYSRLDLKLAAIVLVDGEERGRSLLNMAQESAKASRRRPRSPVMAA